jgi:DnaJ like chaperone protein
VAENAGSEEIRTAWKRLVKEYHPDRLRAEGLPDEFVEAANDKLAAINQAYKLMRAEAERRAAGQTQQS